ncbi:hypothetical protein P7C73_g1661, partial [Tremellales sp. Uapishka_1]
MDLVQNGESSQSPSRGNGHVTVDGKDKKAEMSSLILPPWDVPPPKALHASLDLISLLHLDTLYNTYVRPYADPEEGTKSKGKRKKLDKGYQGMIEDCIDPVPLGEKHDRLSLLPLIPDWMNDHSHPLPDLFNGPIEMLDRERVFREAKLQVGSVQEGYRNGTKLGVKEAEERRRLKREKNLNLGAVGNSAPSPGILSPLPDPMAMTATALPIAPPSKRPPFPIRIGTAPPGARPYSPVPNRYAAQPGTPGAPGKRQMDSQGGPPIKKPKTHSRSASPVATHMQAEQGLMKKVLKQNGGRSQTECILYAMKVLPTLPPTAKRPLSHSTTPAPTLALPVFSAAHLSPSLRSTPRVPPLPLLPVSATHSGWMFHARAPAFHIPFRRVFVFAAFHNPEGSKMMDRSRSDRNGHGRSNSLGAGLGSVPMGASGSSSPAGGSENEWADIQARTFWRLNTKLESQGLDPMTSLVRDFADGVKLIQLLEIMSESSLGRYNQKPKLRVQKAENASKALQFIRDRGVKLTNIGPEDILDGNLKLILGMIWTLILRFTIAGITEEGLSARDGLLLWCQRKTAPYPEVQVVNFKQSFSDGLALCALIHRHRPELLDWNSLDKSDRRGNTALAFKVAEESLGIPRLLEVADLCDVEVPDERSVMTYVAEFFHKFSSEDKAETVARRVEKFAELMQGIWSNKNDFERRMENLQAALATTQSSWSASPGPTTYPEAISHLSQFAEYKKTSKRAWVKERQELAALYSNIQTKLRTYGLRSWEPRDGLRLQDLEGVWGTFLVAEGKRSRAINAQIREIKEALRKEFARKAEEFMAKVTLIEQAIGGLRGSLPEQKQTLLRLSDQIPLLRSSLTTEVATVNQSCLEAKVEENDYTVLTLDDLTWELELAEAGVRKKIAFVENQMVSATHTNLTPAKLEEFESTFKHFDKDDTNTLNVYEMHSALASLGIVYADEEIDAIYSQLEAEFGALSYEAWLALLVEITKDDSSSPDQLREAFRGMAEDKPYVTEIDFEHAALPPETVRFLVEVMPEVQVDSESAERSYDYHSFLATAFSRS